MSVGFLRTILTPGLALLLLTAAAPPPSQQSSPPDPKTLDLAGAWQFQLDPEDRGVVDHWYEKNLEHAIQLPGAIQNQGFGHPVALDTQWTGQIVDRSFFDSPRYAPYRPPHPIKLPFWLQPDRHYVGPAWFSREITINPPSKSLRWTLSLERPHITTRLWLDGREIGQRDSLSTPHLYDLGTLDPGSHRLTLRVDNRLAIEVGINAHSVSDHTQGNWNGVVGRIELLATPLVWIEDLQVYPEIHARAVTVRGRLGRRPSQPDLPAMRLEITPPEHASPPPPAEAQVHWGPDGGHFQSRIPLGDPIALWDEFHPALYSLSASAPGVEPRKVSFGMREITTQGTQFLLNGRPIFFRGTLECCVFPATGYPPTTMPEWLRILAIARQHGLNHLRFHSWCPPEAAFQAADQLGFYLQIECASWPNSGSTLGEGRPLDRWLYQEADRILAAYGNHPSFLLLAAGNEPAGPPGEAQAYLGPWVDHFKSRDPRRLYTSASGWPQIPQNQFHVTPDPRIQAWGQGLASRINARPPETISDYRGYVQARTVPVIAHEIGQWCAYPNLEEIPRYMGPLKPRNFEIFLDFLKQNQMNQQAHDFLIASGKLQALCYKEEIESALRTPGFGGFALLGLTDFPGQGTAPVGILDSFWNSKPYITPREFSRFCAPIVPLARLPKRILTTQDRLDAAIELYHFGPDDLQGRTLSWSLLQDQTPLASGSFDPRDYPARALHPVGSLSLPLDRLSPPAKLTLVVRLDGSDIQNDWDLWVYAPPAPSLDPTRVRITRAFDQPAQDHLAQGGSLLLLIPPDQVATDVALGFSSIFWNTAWTQGQPPHTLGILCQPDHPAFHDFPTDSHSNWQWWELLSAASPLVLDHLPQQLQPLIQPIDTWFRAHKLALAFESKIGPGKLLVCSIDLASNLPERPVARQLRTSLLNYMASPAFQPQLDLAPAQIRSLLKHAPPSPPAQAKPH
jgi:hypothetical protein